MKTDFTKSWNEISKEDQAKFDLNCGKAVMKSVSQFADTHNIDVSNCADLMTWNAEREWNAKHIPAVRKTLVAQAKMDLKTCQTVEEAEAVRNNLAAKLETVGF